MKLKFNLFQIDFTLSVFFVVYFFVRFLAAEDKVLMLFSMESIIDFLTLPPVFLSGKHSIFHILAEIRCIEVKE